MNGPSHGGCNFVVAGDWSFSGSMPSGSGSDYISINVDGPSPLSGTVQFRNISVDLGTVSLAAPATVFHTFNVNFSSTFNPNGNKVSIGAAAGYAFTINSNATLMVDAATFAGNYSINPSTIAPGSTINYNAAGAQTVSAFAYGNLVLSGSGAKSIGNGASVVGNLSIAPAGGGATASVVAGLALNTASLTLGGVNRISGTWGSCCASCPAIHKDSTYFGATATGVVNVSTDTRSALSVTAQPDRSMQIVAIGLPETNYLIRASTNLTTWTTIGETNGTPDGLIFFRDLDATNYPSRFYRLALPQ